MLPQLSFTNEQLEEIDEVLQKLHWDTEAQCILVADITGQLVSVLGQTEMNTAVLSALAAGNLSATKEMARLVGEPARFKLLLHEGENRSVYLSDVGEELVLITVFSNHIPIGLVRLSTQVAVQKLLTVVEKALANDLKQAQLPKEIGDSLTNEINASLDDLFGF